jgi:hypothetical protein
MKRITLSILGILAIVLVGAAVLLAFRDADVSTLEIRAVASNLDVNGSGTITLVVTNGNSRLFPWFATVETSTGESPYYVVETKAQDGWIMTSNLRNHSFSHSLLPQNAWEVHVPLDESDQPRRVTIFYTIGHRKLPWVQHEARELLKNLGLVKEIRELRCEIPPASQIGPANESQPLRSETNRTSWTAGENR